MKGDLIPGGDALLRHVGAGRVQGSAVDGSAFRLKPDEEGLSVSWMNALSGSKDDQLAAIRTLARRSFGKNDKFAELCTNDIVARIEEECPGVRSVEEPLEAEGEFPADPSHAEVLGLPAAGSDMSAIVGDLISECITNLYPAKKSTT